MFKLSAASNYSWPVNFVTPKDGGQFEKHSFDATFKRVSKSSLEKILDKVASGEMTDIQFCSEVLVGFSGIKDENGEEIPFSQSAVAQLLDVQGVTKAIFHAFTESISGQKAKN